MSRTPPIDLNAPNERSAAPGRAGASGLGTDHSPAPRQEPATPDPGHGFEPPDRIEPAIEATADGEETAVWGVTSASFASGPAPTEDDLEAALRRLEVGAAADTTPVAASAPTQPATGSPAVETRGRVAADPVAPVPSVAPIAVGQPSPAPPTIGEPAGPGPVLDWIKAPPTVRIAPHPAPRPERAVPGEPRPVPEQRGQPPRSLAIRVPSGVALVLQAIAIALVTRVVLAGVVWLSLRAFPRFPRYPQQLRDTFFPDHPALDGWARWDASHYVAIAAQGYGEPGPSPHGGAGFFPLFPLLMRGAVATVGAAPTPAALALAALVIANVCFLGAVPLLARLTADRFGDAAGRTAALLLCVTPFGFFFGAAYSESLFLLLALAALTAGGRGRWRWAGVAAGLASGTRLVGLALLPALLVQAHRRGANRRELVGIALLAPAGTVGYAAYSAWVFGDPFAYFRAQAIWGGWDEHVRFYAELFVRQPREALGGDPRHLIILLNVGVALVCLALLPRVWRTLDPGVAVFTTLLVVVQTGSTWVSLGRYLLPAVGLYAVMGALLTHRRLAGWPRDLTIATAALLLAVLAVLYGHGFWVV